MIGHTKSKWVIFWLNGSLGKLLQHKISFTSPPRKIHITLIKSIISVVVYNMSKPSIDREVWIKSIIAQLIHYPQPHLGDLILQYIRCLNWMIFLSTFTSNDWRILLSPSSVSLFVSWFVCTITHNIFYTPDERWPYCGMARVFCPFIRPSVC